LVKFFFGYIIFFYVKQCIELGMCVGGFLSGESPGADDLIPELGVLIDDSKAAIPISLLEYSVY
jgi:hypothetical protein